MKLSRALFALLVGFALSGSAAGSGAPACTRLLEKRDVHVDVKDNALTVLIANVSDRCSIRFSDGLKTAPGQENAWPMGLAVRIESIDGRILSRTKFMGDWYVAEEHLGDARLIDFSLITLAPERVRAKRWAVGRLLRFIDSWLATDGYQPLPWGSKVVVRVSVSIWADPEAAAGRFGKTGRSVQVMTPPFLYTLPASPFSD